MVILENIDIGIDIDKAILQNIDIDKISNRFKFGISNRATWHGISQLKVFDLNIYHSECDIKIVYLAPFDDEDDNDNGKHSKNESNNHWYSISSSPPAPPW